MKIQNCYTDLSLLTSKELMDNWDWFKDKLLESPSTARENAELKEGLLLNYYHLGFEEESDMLWLSDYSDQYEEPKFKKLDFETFKAKYEKQLCSK